MGATFPFLHQPIRDGLISFRLRLISTNFNICFKIFTFLVLLHTLKWIGVRIINNAHLPNELFSVKFPPLDEANHICHETKRASLLADEFVYKLAKVQKKIRLI